MSLPRVIVLNGGSSSGKSSIARELQSLLDGLWLRLGVDTLIDAALPATFADEGLVFGDDGEVAVGSQFRALEAAWMAGVACMARHGALLLVEDNFISGPEAQRRWADALSGISAAWVGVHCDAIVAEERESTRGNRVAGMAAKQAVQVHRGISYDLEVDTTTQPAHAVARAIQSYFALPRRPR